MAEIFSQTGKKIIIAQTSFANAIGLKNAIQKVLIEQKIDISKIEINNFSNIASFLQAGCAIDSDPEVNRFLFLCLEKSLFDGERITPAMFERIEARECYYEILYACLKETLSPFFAPLFSKLKSLEKPTPEKNLQ